MKYKYHNRLEMRLVDFSVACLNLIEELPGNTITIALTKQLSRSATSPALNYGEAQMAESRRDFIHKMKVCLKELKETEMNLGIIRGLKYLTEERIEPLISENKQLIAIFISSIKTAERNSTFRNTKGP